MNNIGCIVRISIVINTTSIVSIRTLLILVALLA